MHVTQWNPKAASVLDLGELFRFAIVAHPLPHHCPAIGGSGGRGGRGASPCSCSPCAESPGAQGQATARPTNQLEVRRAGPAWAWLPPNWPQLPIFHKRISSRLLSNFHSLVACIRCSRLPGVRADHRARTGAREAQTLQTQERRNAGTRGLSRPDEMAAG